MLSTTSDRVLEVYLNGSFLAYSWSLGASSISYLSQIHLGRNFVDTDQIVYKINYYKEYAVNTTYNNGSATLEGACASPLTNDIYSTANSLIEAVQIGQQFWDDKTGSWFQGQNEWYSIGNISDSNGTYAVQLDSTGIVIDSVVCPPETPQTYEYRIDVNETLGATNSQDGCGNILNISVYSEWPTIEQAVEVGAVIFDSNNWPSSFNGDFKWYSIGTTSDLDGIYSVLLSNTGTIQQVVDCTISPTVPTVPTYYYQATNCEDSNDVITIYSVGQSVVIGKIYGDGPVIGNGCYQILSTGGSGGFNIADFTEYNDCVSCTGETPAAPTAPTPPTPTVVVQKQEYVTDVNQASGWVTSADACGNIIGISIWSDEAILANAVQVGQYWYSNVEGNSGWNGDFKWYGVGTTSDLDSTYAILLSSGGIVQQVVDCTVNPTVPTTPTYYYQATNCQDSNDIITIYSVGQSVVIGKIYGNGPVIGDGCYQILSTGGSNGFNISDFTEYNDCVSCTGETPVAPTTPPVTPTTPPVTPTAPAPACQVNVAATTGLFQICSADEIYSTYATNLGACDMCGFTYIQGDWITSLVGANTIFYVKYNNKYGTFKRNGSSNIAYAVSGGDSGYSNPNPGCITCSSPTTPTTPPVAPTPPVTYYQLSGCQSQGTYYTTSQGTQGGLFQSDSDGTFLYTGSNYNYLPGSEINGYFTGSYGCPTPPAAPTPPPPTTPPPVVPTGPTLYYYILQNCANSSQLQYGYSTDAIITDGDTFSYFGNCYRYYDVDPDQLGSIDLDPLSPCSCTPPNPPTPPPPVVYEYRIHTFERTGTNSNTSACGQQTSIAVWTDYASLEASVGVGAVWYVDQNLNPFDGDFRWYGVSRTDQLGSTYSVLLSNAGTVQQVYDCSTPPPVAPTPPPVAPTPPTYNSWETTDCSTGNVTNRVPYDESYSIGSTSVQLGSGCSLIGFPSELSAEEIPSDVFANCSSCNTPPPPVPTTPPPVVPTTPPVAPALTEFFIRTSGFANPTSACDQATIASRYHNGAGALPTNGDRVYISNSTSNPMLGDDIYYAINTTSAGTNTEYGIISSTGFVSGRGTCPSTPPPVPTTPPPVPTTPPPVPTTPPPVAPTPGPSCNINVGATTSILTICDAAEINTTTATHLGVCDMCGFLYLEGAWIASIAGPNTQFSVKYNGKYGSFKRNGSSNIAYAISGGDSGFDNPNPGCITCSSPPPPPPPPPSPPADNVFTVERSSDGFATYAQLVQGYYVNDLVELDSDGLGVCYEIMGTAYVLTPGDWPVIVGVCNPPPPPAAPVAPPPPTCYPMTLSKNTTSASACTGNTRTYYLDTDRLDTANVVYSNSGCTAGVFQSAGYFSDGLQVRYWNGSSLGPVMFCSF